MTLTLADIFGGQSLGGTNQFGDLWILSLPQWTWTSVDSPNPPSPRAGHSCDLVGSNLLVIGGYANTSTCDAQPAYVLDTASCTWQTAFQPSTTYNPPLIVANISSTATPLLPKPTTTNGNTSSSSAVSHLQSAPGRSRSILCVGIVAYLIF